MLVGYVDRLVWLALACLFLFHVLGEALVIGLAPAASAFSDRFTSRVAARILFCVRVFPAAGSMIATAAVCLLVYLQPGHHWITGWARWLWIGAAPAGLMLLLVSVRGLLQNLARSREHMRRWRVEARRESLGEIPIPAYVIDGDVPFLAMAGIVRPVLIASRGLVRALTPGQLNAALAHEAAHRVFHDNLKRLIMRSIPSVLPFAMRLRSIEKSWAKCTEQAADDRAVAGTPVQAALLAEALLRVAQIGGLHPSGAATALLADGSELHDRVNRLLNSASRRVRRENMVNR